jgi:methylenetetrahydrofolate--tRNA-(uracil-5-)-methyltransferase
MEMADRHPCPPAARLPSTATPFAEAGDARLRAHPNITVEDGEITALPDGRQWIIATGPLTSGALAEAIRAETGPRRSPSSTPSRPIVYADSDRHGRGLGCSRAMTRARPRPSARPISTARWTRDEHTRPSSTRCWPPTRPSSSPAKPPGYFDGCLPIEVMAERGRETLRHGPMKPVGLTNPHNPRDVKPMPWCSCAATTSSARSTTSSASRPR